MRKFASCLVCTQQVTVKTQTDANSHQAVKARYYVFCASLKISTQAKKKNCMTYHESQSVRLQQKMEEALRNYFIRMSDT